MLGVFKLEQQSQKSPMFKPIPQISGEPVYALLNYISPNGKERLIAASLREIYEVNDNKATPLQANVETYRLLQSKVNPSRIYIATSRGIRTINQKDKLLVFDKSTFALPNESVTKITEDKNGNLWCNTLTGIHLIDRNGNSFELPQTIKDKSGTFFNIKDDVFLIASDKAFIFNQQTNEFSPSEKLNNLFFNQNKNLREVIHLNDSLALAYYSTHNSSRANLLVIKDDKWYCDTLSLRIIPPMTINTALADETKLLVGGQDGLFIHSTKRVKDFHQAFHTLIRQITIGTDSVIFKGADDFFTTITDEQYTMHQLSAPIDYRHNNIIFSFSATFFEGDEEVFYRSYLQGFDRDWSNWQSNVTRTYTNLKEGSYRFYVKSKNLYGVEGGVAVFEFRILPPWYRTWWAYVIYVILGFVVIRISIAWYTRKLQEDKRRLEVIVRERTAEIVEKNKRIESQNISITDSIKYAKRIQTAVLPNKQTSPLFDYFIYFVPKDIVSGDFYWIHHFEKQQRLIAIAADCTGHGVPGAFMSMLGTSFLNEIVAKLDVNHSDSILNLLREYVIKTLSQGVKAGSESQQKDGMDLALVSIDLSNKILEFSGANNPLLLIRDNELIEYKPDKMPIGSYVKQDIPFKRNEIELKSGDTFYLFSDGYVDQFGGHDGRKYMKKKFKEFLLVIHKEPLAIQKDMLAMEMKKWMEGHEQVDDQIVIGLKAVF
jgi:serine phosphatase RsbU (regulator of sigma subunit)